ncbi:methionyl-tRNA formyltransferase [Gracilibacillus caseinilyticus]|uniref:Methionyl-tRNA formyltransferase n=1 Tax=Gracilibacillus caseinilyticus TaxID=2932256 RepID=A0ABY4EUM7_9BACI|nr:methionyl-tRNA formyltransferase [Gracilibacillus caseinilyticus]UOQ47923.1 methionyl-tRNA formyltransferase [Gracilibacillus caseinilyticus]
MNNIIFMGTPDFAVPVLERILAEGYQVDLVVTQPDRPRGRKRIMTPPPVKAAAEKHQIPVFQPEKIKDNYQDIEDLKPDLIVTAAFGQLLPKGLLEIPTYGCINVHASLLPSLRGGAPIHYSILEGHQQTGISIMYMAEKLDAGDVISQKALTIAETDDVGSLHDKLATIGADLLADTIPSIFSGEANREEQDESLATFAPNITREQEKIDWNQTQQVVFNKIRGLHPWPVAFTLWQGKIFKVYHADKATQFSNQPAGTIIDASEEGITVATGDEKAVRLTTVQPAGKKKMTAAEFLRGVGSNLKVGEKLGE